jgi:hypothetical protein
MNQISPEEYVQQVIDGHGGIEALDAATQDHMREFSSLWDADAERIGRVLKAHLTVEYFLTRYIEYNNPNLPSIREVRLTFSQKMDFISPSDSLLYDLKPGIKRLNQIRNRLAHNIHVEIDDNDINVFYSIFLFKKMREALNKGSVRDLSRVPIIVYEDFAKFAAITFQARSSPMREIWASASLPKEIKS